MFVVSNLFHLQNITGVINFDFVDFSDNIIKDHVINAIFLQSMIINNTNCSNCNFINDYPNVKWSSIGGCFKTKNILKRQFENINIINSFSDKTSFGIKIIDDMNQLKTIPSFNIININV